MSLEELESEVIRAKRELFAAERRVVAAKDELRKERERLMGRSDFVVGLFSCEKSPIKRCVYKESDTHRDCCLYCEQSQADREAGCD